MVLRSACLSHSHAPLHIQRICLILFDACPQSCFFPIVSPLFSRLGSIIRIQKLHKAEKAYKELQTVISVLKVTTTRDAMMWRHVVLEVNGISPLKECERYLTQSKEYYNLDSDTAVTRAITLIYPSICPHPDTGRPHSPSAFSSRLLLREDTES